MAGDRDQAQYSRAVVEGLIEGSITSWDGAKTSVVPTTSLYDLRSRIERTGRVDPGWDAYDSEAFVTVLDVERAVAQLARTDPMAAVVVILTVWGLEPHELADLFKGKNVGAAAVRAQKWISKYLSGSA